MSFHNKPLNFHVLVILRTRSIVKIAINLVKIAKTLSKLLKIALKQSMSQNYICPVVF